MTSKEALKSICLECEIWKGKNKVRCPFRSISNDYCEEYDAIKKDLDRLEKLERIFEILQRHLYICYGFIECRITTEKNFRECLSNSWTKFYNGMKVIDEDYYELYDLWNELLKEGKQNDN